MVASWFVLIRICLLDPYPSQGDGFPFYRHRDDRLNLAASKPRLPDLSFGNGLAQDILLIPPWYPKQATA